MENDFDFIAASFVRKASDVEDIRSELHKHGGDDIRIIAKIENREGVTNLDDIIAAVRRRNGGPGRPWGGDPRP